MHVIKINDDQSLSWIEVPDPMMHDNEVLINIKCAAMNRADLLQRAGNYPPPPGSPEWMGLEVSGIVEAVGEKAVGGWKVGDAVCALLGGGGYAEKVAVDGSMLLPVPKGVSMIEAAALPEVYATSFLNLQFEAGIKAGDTVFIQAGASGLGIAATQLAKAWGAKVITTVSNDRKAEASRKVGADIVVNRKTEDVGAVLDANPPNIVLDCVGGEGLGKYFNKMAHGGRWILIATLGGGETTIDLRKTLTKNLRLIGSTLRSRPPAMKAWVLGQLREKVWPLVESGQIRPVIYATYPLREAAAAQQIMLNQENIGKIVLTVD